MITRCIQNILEENSVIKERSQEIIKKTSEKALLRDDTLFVLDEQPISKRVTTPEDGKYRESPFIAILETGGETTELPQDHNRSIQILLRVPDEYVDLYIFNIKKQLEGTFGYKTKTSFCGQTFCYDFYVIRGIGQPIFLESKNGFSFYVLKFNAGYTIWEEQE